MNLIYALFICQGVAGSPDEYCFRQIGEWTRSECQGRAAEWSAQMTRDPSFRNMRYICAARPGWDEVPTSSGRGAKTQPTTVSTKDPNHAEPMCNTAACGQVAEVASRQAYDTCRRGGGRPDICTKKALDAWFATGAIPPYAHTCTAVNVARDYLGRCQW